ncbi:2-C-methyl-D-erythritol 4-phosphate cytidylyltransferase [Peptostreptococcus faecalis]|uniref:2-C-methyl-D-erythritol 4-phosphate cytidylyltransferase n=1 Tax=Peptostreptococcus faecalis TaxID=2045015 RepID=UPI000C7AF770|nr:2-C-methyl-D-erythritol 4-phosphate cytidylyltransferase [Peptostreptococcus faecalis]
MVYAIIVAAGSGTRMNAGKNKQFIDVNGKPLIAWTIDKFYKCRRIDEIILAIRKEDEDIINSVLLKYNFRNIKIVYGGDTRQDSIYNCIKSIDSEPDILLIHDGARPMITEEIIVKSIEGSKKYGCACIGVPVKDTIKILDNEEFISDTPNRDLLWIAQTPQSFKFDIIKSSYINAYKKNLSATDDASLVEKFGYKVKMILGEYSNIKVTTPDDLKHVEYLMK